MKSKKKLKEQDESPLDLTRRLRREYFAQFKGDLKKAYKDLKASEKKCKDQMIDPKTLPKK